MTYEKPSVTRLGSLAEMTLWKTEGPQDFLGMIISSIGGPDIGGWGS